MAKKKKEERSEGVVLPDKQTIQLPVSGIEVEIKSWSWGESGEIMPHIDEILEKIEASNIDLSSLPDMFLFQEEIQDKIIDGVELSSEEKEKYDRLGSIANRTMLKLFSKIGHLAMPILVMSTGMKEKDLNALSPFDVYMLAMNVYYANQFILGNVFQPFGIVEMLEGLDEKDETKKK